MPHILTKKPLNSDGHGRLRQEPALAAMFERKYQNPEAYWREYPGWWAEWKDKLSEKDISGGTVGFYSGDGTK